MGVTFLPSKISFLDLEPLSEPAPAFRILEAILFNEAKNLFFEAEFLEEDLPCLED